MLSGRRALGLLAGSLAFGGVPACGDEGNAQGEPACLGTPADLDCQPLYGLVDGAIAPTFDQVYENTLSKCAVAGCHDAERRAGGMSLADADTAHASLRANGSNGRPRVTPGDLECGRLVVRLETEGESWSMPPSAHLSEPALCSLRHWIHNGAER